MYKVHSCGNALYRLWNGSNLFKPRNISTPRVRNLNRSQLGNTSGQTTITFKYSYPPLCWQANVSASTVPWCLLSEFGAVQAAFHLRWRGSSHFCLQNLYDQVCFRNALAPGYFCFQYIFITWNTENRLWWLVMWGVFRQQLPCFGSERCELSSGNSAYVGLWNRDCVAPE